MKIKFNFSTIIFYLISVAAFLVITINNNSPIISLMLLVVFSCSLYLGSFYLQCGNKNYSNKIMKLTFLTLFISYSLFTLSLLFTNLYFGRGDISQADINLIPFKTILIFINSASAHTLPRTAIITNLLGNFIAFMPLAFYLPLFYKRTRKFWFFIVIVTALIIVIETMQLLLNCGSCDIDDLILNVLGAAASYPIFNNKNSQKLIKKLTMF